MLPLNLIDADILQPRKNFNPERLGELMESIKKHGIINPLIVEEAKGGRYILVDGERRYRAAKELKMTPVPAVIVKPQNDIDRLVQQFHLQEQHQGWTALEKAMAVSRLADELKMSVKEVAELLSMHDKTVHDYVAFSKLMERSMFERNETPLHFAPAIILVKEAARKSFMNGLKKEFTADRGRQLEKAIITRIKQRTIARPKDMVKLRDAIKSNPNIVDKFIDDESMTTDKAFLDSKGQVAWFFRNTVNNANSLANSIRGGKPLGMDKMFENDTVSSAALKVAYEQLKSLINHI